MDTDYFSAESVYDRTLGKKQSEINSTASSITQKQYANGSIVQYINNRTIVISIGGALSAPTGAQTLLATLTDHKPPRAVYAICGVDGGASGKFCLVSVSANGQILAYNYSGTSAAYLFGTVTYVV